MNRQCNSCFLIFLQCNVQCGNGTQRRDIICVQKTGNDFTVVPATECAHLDKPAAVQECEMGECEPQWFTTEWSAVRDEGGLRAKWFKEKRSGRLWLKTVFFTHSLPLFSVLALLWKGLTNEGGTVSDARQKAQPRLWYEAQTWTGANLQHNTLQSTSLRLVCVCMTLYCTCVSQCLPHTNLSLLLFASVHRWKLPGQTSQLRDGGSGEAVRLLLLQERLLCLVYSKCPAC